MPIQNLDGEKDGSMSMRKGSACLKRTVQALEKSIEGSCVNPCADEWFSSQFLDKNGLNRASLSKNCFVLLLADVDF